MMKDAALSKEKGARKDGESNSSALRIRTPRNALNVVSATGAGARYLENSVQKIQTRNAARPDRTSVAKDMEPLPTTVNLTKRNLNALRLLKSITEARKRPRLFQTPSKLVLHITSKNSSLRWAYFQAAPWVNQT